MGSSRLPPMRNTFFGAAYVEATPESYLKLASSIDALAQAPRAISQSRVSAIRPSFPTLRTSPCKSRTSRIS